jgi:dienelactone hydrolase
MAGSDAPSIINVLFPAVRHEVSFWHGSDRLTGDLVLPGSTGRYPVLVLVGEPNDPHRDHSSWLDGLAAAGIAGFTWDRVRGRDGRGATAGPGARSGLQRVGDQAREVLAALDRLRWMPELDPACVAVMGWGEGGLAAAQAATFSDEIRALILACTPTGRPARDVDGRDVDGPDVGAQVDPWPTLSALSVPVLALFGEQDPVVPLEAGVRGVRQALRAAGHDDHQVAVLRGADHRLRVRPGHGLGPMVDGRHSFGDWPAGLTELLVGWLEGRIRPLARVPAFAPPAASWPDGPAEPSRAALPDQPPDRRTEHGQTEHGQAEHGRGRIVPVRQVRRRITR